MSCFGFMMRDIGPRNVIVKQEMPIGNLYKPDRLGLKYIFYEDTHMCTAMEITVHP